MNPELITAISNNGNSAVMYVLVFLQISQMVNDFFKDRNKDKIDLLTQQVKELTESHISNKVEIETLKNKVFNLETERAKLIGLLSSQEMKEQYIKSIVDTAVNE